MLVYVDDILLIGDENQLEMVISKLEELFTITNLGRPRYFLGVKIEFRTDGIFLSQSSYTQKIIEMANMCDAKPTLYPLPLSHPLYEEVKDLSTNDTQAMKMVPFRKVLGALLFLSTRTRPDISTAVSMIAKFQSNPSPSHWKMLKHVVKYLIGTKEFGILLPSQSTDVEVLSWSDADWARDLSKRRSRTCLLITINNGPIIWTSKLQSTTAQSTAEAEFIALSSAVKEIKWLRSILIEISVLNRKTIDLKQDNLGTISWTEEVNGLRKVKHIGIKYHVVRDTVESKIINVGYTPSSLNRADGFTKVLIGDEFLKHRKWIGVTC